MNWAQSMDWTGLSLWTGSIDWTGGLSWKQILNNNPLQYWRHTIETAGTALPYKPWQ